MQNKMTVLELATRQAITVDDVQSLALLRRGAFLAFRRYPPTRDSCAARAQRRREADPAGSTLTVRNLPPAADTTFGNVTGICVAGQRHQPGDDDRRGRARRATRSRCSIPRRGRCACWIADRRCSRRWRGARNRTTWRRCARSKQDGYDGESYAVLAWKALGEKRTAQVDAPQRIVARARRSGPRTAPPSMSGIAEWLKKPAGKKSDEDPSTVEVWHWKDENVISEQKLTAARDRDRNMLAAWHVAGGRLTPLATNVKEQSRLREARRRALALDGTPYQNDSMFGRQFTDVYKVDLETGARALVAKNLIPPVDFSPGGRYAMNFQDGHFQVYDLESGASATSARTRAGRKFTNQENDYPVSQKPAYGIAGWTKNDHSVIVYDAYDLWELFPDGSPSRGA